MDNRSWEAGASGAPPAPPLSPSPGYPTNGDPLASTPATLPGAWWFHQLGEELRAILLAAGLTPDAASTTQLLEAILRLIDAQSGNYAPDTGAANACVVTLDPVIAAYANGLTLRIKVAVTNTGAVTLNAGAGALALVNNAGGALLAGDLPAGVLVTATYISSAGKFYVNEPVPSQLGQGGITQAQGDARYAALAGLATQVFSVATAVNPDHAVRKDQMEAALAAIPGFGVGQAWAEYTASRSIGVNYTNTTNSPIVVSINPGASSSVAEVSAVVNGLLVSRKSTDSGGWLPLLFMVGPGDIYSVTGTNIVFIAVSNGWFEYR